MSPSTFRLERVLRLTNDNVTDNVWGGRWIADFKGLSWGARTIGEAWEFSGHPAHPSQVNDGEFTLSLLELLTAWPDEVLGEAVLKRFGPKAPFLLKFIDAEDDLSVQVHPDDAYAKAHETDLGKAESWYVLDTRQGQDAALYVGFNSQHPLAGQPDQMKNAFREAINKANAMGVSEHLDTRRRAAEIVLPFLNRIPVRAGDAFNVDPGTLHAIGAGVRLFEIQQTSDLTYRVWDWNRPDPATRRDGQAAARPLHLNKAFDVLSLNGASKLERKPLESGGSVRASRVIESQVGGFSMDLIELNQQDSFEQDMGGSFSVLTCIKGEAVVSSGSSSKVTILPGHSVMLAAAAKRFRIEGKKPNSEVLRSFVTPAPGGVRNFLKNLF